MGLKYLRSDLVVLGALVDKQTNPNPVLFGECGVIAPANPREAL